MGQGGVLRSALADEALAYARDVADAAERVGPMMRTSIKSESGLDLDTLARRARRLLSRTVPERGRGSDAPRLFDDGEPD
jgi:hypothetical protein